MPHLMPRNKLSHIRYPKTSPNQKIYKVLRSPMDSNKLMGLHRKQNLKAPFHLKFGGAPFPYAGPIIGMYTKHQVQILHQYKKLHQIPKEQPIKPKFKQLLYARPGYLR